MKGFVRWLPALVILTALVLGLGRLFILDSESGNSFPYYSSFRSDRWGTRALYEGLSGLEGLKVSRETNFTSRLHTSPELLIVPGLSRQSVEAINKKELQLLKNDATLGSRVVLGFHHDPEQPATLTLKENTRTRKQREEWREERKKIRLKEQERKKADGKSPKEGETKDKEESEATDEAFIETSQKVWKEILGVDLVYAEESFQDEFTIRTKPQTDNLPNTIVHENDLYFEVDEKTEWNVLYTRGGRKIALERHYGKGSIVLIADMNALGNGHLKEPGAARLISYLLSNYNSVRFLENLSGIKEEVGIGHLARRYGLGGAYLLTFLLGMLYLWRHLAPFTPTRDPSDTDVAIVRVLEGEDGFTRLINRSLGRSQLFDACVSSCRQARKRTARPQTDQRFETALRDDKPQQRVVERYNAVVRSLKKF